MKRFSLILLSSLVTLTLTAQNYQWPLELTSGMPVPAGATEGVSTFSFRFQTSPVLAGSAFVSGGEYPDLFANVSAHQREKPTVKGQRGVWYCPYVKTLEDGRLLYSTGRKIDAPWDIKSQNVKIVTCGEDILAVQFTTTKVSVAKFDRATLSFGKAWESSFKIDFPQHVVSFDIIPPRDGSRRMTLVALGLSIANDSQGRADLNNFSIYGTDGIYKSTFPYGQVWKAVLDLDSQSVSMATAITPVKTILSPTGIKALWTEDGHFDGSIICNKMGVMKRVTAEGEVDYLFDSDGKAVVNLQLVHRLFSFGRNFAEAGRCYVTAGEGEVYHYGENYKPSIIMMDKGDIRVGSLSNPCIADWDGDGALDIVAGNSSGHFFYFKNYGTNEKPLYGDHKYLYSVDELFCVRAGYYELQGPMESCWGYASPVVFDWNGDGLQDIVYSYNEGKYMYMLNEGTATEPRLGAPHTIYCDGLELYGVWRCRPGLFKENGQTYIMICDGEESFHLYRKSGENSVIDLGQIFLEGGKKNTGWNAEVLKKRNGGANGRKKLELVDWDGDGDLDLFVGTARQGSFPDPEYGLPDKRQGEGCMQLIYFENVGTTTAPVYKYPRYATFKGQDYTLGGHEQCPSAGYIGTIRDGRPNLILGVECGRFIFFEHNDLTLEEFVW